ncbi:mpv17-like protein [Gigantopelta aegis]|uniref:mpv17-like protein n=1 Tax=Gigantopelta aegis TaxID=1735272 RepID=UPI001B887684|nr:mpv17-like protein [Gigantopelta aegis]
MVLIFKTKPLLNTMVTYAIVWTASDINEQKLICRKQKLDPWKTLRMGIVATFVVAPQVFTWLRVAEKLFPGKTLRIVIKKVISEQILFTPAAILCFYAATSVLERKDPVKEIKEKSLKTYGTGLMWWPFVQSVNFRFVPHQYKPVFVAGASFIWSNFLSFMKEDHIHQHS